MRTQAIALTIVLLIVGTAVAHQGVKNEVVLDRMNNMMDISNQVKILSLMTRGKQDFDANIAKAAAKEIADHAARMVGLFEANETDALSEAKPEIWENFDDFSAIARELETAAINASITIANEQDLAVAVKSIAATCSACHSDYRK